MGLANNHAGDFGSDALVDSIARLKANDIAVVGAAETPELAYAPHFFTARDGQKAAVIALSDLEDDRNDGRVAVASDRDRVATAIAEARAGAGFVLCLVHWGEENTPRVTERQRELARWLIDQGVDVVAGSHSHCRQPLDFYHGRPVIYSLGNLVFDGAPGLESWNRGDLLEVDIGRRGAEEMSIRLLPVRLDARGFPHAANEDQALGKHSRDGRRRFFPQPGAARFKEAIEQRAQHDRAAGRFGCLSQPGNGVIQVVEDSKREHDVKRPKFPPTEILYIIQLKRELRQIKVLFEQKAFVQIHLPGFDPNDLHSLLRHGQRESALKTTKIGHAQTS